MLSFNELNATLKACGRMKKKEKEEEEEEENQMKGYRQKRNFVWKKSQRLYDKSVLFPFDILFIPFMISIYSLFPQKLF